MERLDVDALNALGQEGWEAIAILGDPTLAIMLLKRPADIPVQASPKQDVSARDRFAEMKQRREGTIPAKNEPLEFEVLACLAPGDGFVGMRLDGTLLDIGDQFLVVDDSSGRAAGVWRFELSSAGSVSVNGEGGGGGSYAQARRVAPPRAGQVVRVLRGARWADTEWIGNGVTYSR